MFVLQGNPLLKGNPSKNSHWHKAKTLEKGGLEIVFNQQLSRLSYNLMSYDNAPSTKMSFIISIAPLNTKIKMSHLYVYVGLNILYIIYIQYY